MRLAHENLDDDLQEREGGMKASVVIDRVYRLLGDNGTTKVYNKDKDIIPNVSTAQRHLIQDRPDARLSSAGAWPAITDPTADTSDMLVTEAFTEHVAQLATFFILSTRAKNKLETAGADKFMATYLRLIGV